MHAEFYSKPNTVYSYRIIEIKTILLLRKKLLGKNKDIKQSK